jgi:hypothetical protein
MCQAAEGESDYLVARDGWIRRKGYEAQKARVPRSANPEQDHTLPAYSDKRQWYLGWDTAEAGEEVW